MPFWKKSDSSPPPLPTPRHLPLPTGPHAVGYADVMTPGDVREGVFLRLYYPSQLPLTETINQAALWPLWAEDEYITGFVKFMQAVLARWPSWAPRGEFLYIDQISHIAPAMHLGCTYVWKMLNGQVFCPILRNAPISTEKQWPVLVFSHGLGCSRFAYSRICTDLASHGFLVAAVEHRDGSSCLSFVMQEGERRFIQHRRVGEEEHEYQIRHSQLQQRAEEAIRALDLVTSLAKGDRVKNVLPNSCEFDLSMFQTRLDLSSPVLAGHSFGGATTLLGLSKDQRFKQGLVLDGWLFPLRDHQLSPAQPLVFINTESFASRQNIERTKSFLNTGDSPTIRRMVFIKGSVHQNHIDAPLIFKPGRIKKILGMQSDTEPGLVLDVNNKLMLHFIWSNLHADIDSDIVKFLEHHDDIIIEVKEDKAEVAQDATKLEDGEVSQDSGIADDI